MTKTFIKKYGNFRQESIAGFTGFLTSVYIIFINPAILSDAGMDRGAVFTATCLITALVTFFAGIFANTPIIIAPAMAINLYFTYSVVQSANATWEQALAMVVVSGLLFLIVCVTPLKKMLLDAIPEALQIAILVGISILIAVIALKTNHILDPQMPWGINFSELFTMPSMFFFLGIAIICILDFFHVTGAIIIGIAFVTILSHMNHMSTWVGFISLPPSIKPTFLKTDFSFIYHIHSLKIMTAFFFISMFDAAGTLMGLLGQTELCKMPSFKTSIRRNLVVDATGSMFAGFIGCASTSPYIESAATIKAGGRTGLSAIVTSLGFIAMLFFSPIALSIPIYATSAAIFYVAICMMKHIKKLKNLPWPETISSFLIMILIPYTLSIADGLGVGIIVYVILKKCVRHTIHPWLYPLFFLFILFFVVN